MWRLWWFLAAYLVVLLVAAPRMSFWLDEVLTLTGAVEPDFASLMVNLRKQQGATPLAFLVPHWAIEVFGLSKLSARLPSILASVAACPAIYLLAQRLGVKHPIVPVTLFALWPLQFRYALEVRPYALALCLSAWLTLVFLKESRRRTYALLTVTMGLTHPYSLAIPAGHLAWSLLFERRRALVPAVALALALLALAPWYAYFGEGWRTVSAEQQLGAANPRAVLVFVREITGSGYIGAAILFTAVGLGLREVAGPRSLLVALTVVPIALVPLMNVAFDYFFAVRQLIYILPAAVLLFALRPYHFVLGFLVVSAYSDAIWVTRPREDWASASAAIARGTEEGACVQFVADSEKLLAFFHPELRSRVCAGDENRVVLAGSTYEPMQAAARATLKARGFRKESEQTFVAPIVEVYSR